MQLVLFSTIKNYPRILSLLFNVSNDSNCIRKDEKKMSLLRNAVSKNMAVTSYYNLVGLTRKPKGLVVLCRKEMDFFFKVILL